MKAMKSFRRRQCHNQEKSRDWENTNAKYAGEFFTLTVPPTNCRHAPNVMPWNMLS